MRGGLFEAGRELLKTNFGEARPLVEQSRAISSGLSSLSSALSTVIIKEAIVIGFEYKQISSGPFNTQQIGSVTSETMSTEV